MVYRIYVEKKSEYAVEAVGLQKEIVNLLEIKNLKNLRMLNRYDVEQISEELFNDSISTVFSEPQVDRVYKELPTAKNIFGVEYLPGQFDQRAQSASECIQLISQGERPTVKTARIYILEGNLTANDVAQIKKYVINKGLICLKQV